MDLNEVWSELYGKQSMLDKILTDETIMKALKPKQISPKIIVREADMTTVYWSDGSKTSVKLCEGDKNDPYAAFCAAFTKRMYGTNSAIRRMIDKADVDVVRKDLKNVYEKKCKDIDEKARTTMRKILKSYRHRRNQIMRDLNAVCMKYGSDKE